MPPRTKKSAAIKPPVEDRLPEWLYRRYGQPHFRTWDHLTGEEAAHWKAEARIVRDAVEASGHD